MLDPANVQWQPVTSTNKPRVIALDRLRVVANFSRLLIHAAVPYMLMKSGMWPIYDSQSSQLFDVMVYLMHSFVNELYFLLCGFFAWRMLQQYGTDRFIRNRMQKILIPFLAGMLLVVPLVISCFSYVTTCMSPAALTFSWKTLIQANLEFVATNGYPLANLWFLYYLLLCYTIWLTGRWLLNQMKLKIQLSRWTFAGLSLIVSFIMLLTMNAWHRDTPLFFAIQWPVLGYFLNYFLIGVGLAKVPSLIGLCRQYYRWLLAGGLLVSCLGVPLQMQYPNQTIPLYNWIHAAAVLAFSVQSFAFVAGLIGFAYAVQPSKQSSITYLAKAAYWTSYIELPIVMVVHILLAPLSLPIAIKFMIAVGLTLLIALTSFSYLISRTFLRQFFGEYSTKTVASL